MSVKKKVFLTGASGFIGSNLLNKLVELNYDVHIITRKRSDNYRIKNILPKIKKYEVDILDQISLRKTIITIKPDIIFHLANVGLYGGVEGKDRTVFNTNFWGTVNILEACKTIDYSCFINTGSSGEYGAKKTKMSENDICFPESIYALSKLSSTLYAKAYSEKFDKPVATLRLFSPYGPYDDKRRLISYVIKKAINLQKIEIGNPNNVRDFIYIDDVVDAFIKCINNPKKIKSKIINIGSGKQLSVKDVVRKIVKISNSKSEIIENANINRQESPTWEADISLAKRLISWKPEINIDEGIKKTVEWYKSNPKFT